MPRWVGFGSIDVSNCNNTIAVTSIFPIGQLLTKPIYQLEKAPKQTPLHHFCVMQNWIPDLLNCSWWIILFSENCTLSTWTKFSSCSKSCGDGTKSRSRFKTVKESNGGTCLGNLTEIEDCRLKPCPGELVLILKPNIAYAVDCANKDLRLF